MYSGKFYYEDGSFKLIDNDTFKTLEKFEDKTFDMIFADPPYFLSNDGIMSIVFENVPNFSKH